MSDLGKRIRRLRYLTGLDLVEWSKYVGYAYSSCRSWEVGRAEPSLKALRTIRRSIGQLLGRTVAWEELLGGADRGDPLELEAEQLRRENEMLSRQLADATMAAERNEAELEETRELAAYLWYWGCGGGEEE